MIYIYRIRINQALVDPAQKLVDFRGCFELANLCSWIFFSKNKVSLFFYLKITNYLLQFFSYTHRQCSFMFEP